MLAFLLACTGGGAVDAKDAATGDTGESVDVDSGADDSGPPDSGDTDSGAAPCGESCRYAGDHPLDEAFAVLTGALRADYAGHSAAVLDFNSDGAADVLVGAHHADDPGTDAGAAYFVPGPIAGAVSLADSRVVALTGARQLDEYGKHVAAGDDYDADGLVDALVAAEQDDEGEERAGAVYVIHASVIRAGSARDVGVKLLGEGNSDRFGQSVATGGDLTGDGLPDVAVGGGGNAYVFASPFGADLPASAAAARLTPENAAAGDAVAAGDLDGDGVNDLLVAAPADDAGGTQAGAVYLLHGPVVSMGLESADSKLVSPISGANLGYGLAFLGDTNGDGHDDLGLGAPVADGGDLSSGVVYVLAGPAPVGVASDWPSATLEGVAHTDFAGRSVGAPGDLDGDGFADLVTGADSATGVVSGSGLAYVVYLPLVGTASLGDVGVRLLGVAESNGAGSFVGGAGDLDGDGHGDLLVGDYQASLTGDGAGALWLFSGRP